MKEKNDNVKKARAAWNRENMKTVGANVKKDVAEKFAEIAKRQGTTPGAMVREFILRTVEKEKSKSGFIKGPYCSPFTVFQMCIRDSPCPCRPAPPRRGYPASGACRRLPG